MPNRSEGWRLSYLSCLDTDMFRPIWPRSWLAGVRSWKGWGNPGCMHDFEGREMKSASLWRSPSQSVGVSTAWAYENSMLYHTGNGNFTSVVLRNGHINSLRNQSEFWFISSIGFSFAANGWGLPLWKAQNCEHTEDHSNCLNDNTEWTCSIVGRLGPEQQNLWGRIPGLKIAWMYLNY